MDKEFFDRNDENEDIEPKGENDESEKDINENTENGDNSAESVENTEEGNEEKEKEASSQNGDTEKAGEDTRAAYEPDIKSGGSKKKRSFGIVLVAAIVAFSVSAALFLGVAGLAAVEGILWLTGIATDRGDQAYETEDTESEVKPDGDMVYDDMNVIKNDGSIDVYEEIGSTGYNDTLTITQVVDLVADTVVEIRTSSVAYDLFYGQYVTNGAGSGVIITENGYIITNHHVIVGAREITVRLTDGSEFAATVIGSDADRDIALLKINAKGLAFAKMGSSAKLSVGQEVIAIGNPLGSLGGTVTDGIISALDRSVTIEGHTMTLMQTNAAINPGNSGGGLFDMSGQLIGIVNAKESDTGIEGLGFAIPIDIAWETVKSIANGGS